MRRTQRIQSADGPGTDGRASRPKRRSVLRALAALGVGGGAVGGATARRADAADPSDGGVPVAIQLFTLRDLPDTTLDLIRRVGGVDDNGGPGFQAVEFAGLGDATTNEVGAALDEVGVGAAGAHVGLSDLEGDSLRETLETYSPLGVTDYVDPSFPVEDLTVANVEALARRYNDVAAALPDGVRVGFHNHDYVFEQVEDGRTALEVFDASLDGGVIFEIDVGWALTAGYDPVEVLRAYSDRTELVHMKDMADGEFYEIGEGAVDVAEVARVAREEANVDYLIYEHDAPADPAGTTGTGAGVLSFLDGRPGLACLDFADVGGPDYDGTLGGVDPGDPVDDDAGTPVGIQLYTLRSLPDTVLDLIRRVGGVDNNGGPGYDVVEFAGLGDATVEEVDAALSETGVDAASAHVGLDQLEGDSFEGTVQTYRGVGVDTFVVPYIAPSSIDTVAKVEALAERMNAVSDRLPDGARLGFHNHDGEFQDLDGGRTPLEVFDATLADDVIFEIDVGWALTAGYDPVDVIRTYSGRTELVHMKDMADGEFYEIGEGAVDLEEAARVAREEANVDALLYEHDEPTDAAGSAGTGAGVLSFLDDAPGLACLDFADVGGPDYDGTLGGGATDYYQVDFVAGGPIENLGEDGLYADQDRLLRYAFGLSGSGITDRGSAWASAEVRNCLEDYGHIVEREDGTASVPFTVAEGCELTVSLVVHSMPDATFSAETADEQVLLDATTRTFGPGEHVVRVGLPGGGGD